MKQQRAEQRAKKFEEYRKREARAMRNRRIGIGAAIVGAVAVVGLIVTSVVLTPGTATYTAGNEGATVDGVETFENGATHVQGAVDYAQAPSAGGDHNQVWLNCGAYSDPVPNENAVHSMEHGAVWVTYDPNLSEEDLSTLRAKLPSTYVALSPYESLPAPIVLSGWNAQLQVEDAGDERIGAFLEEYWRGQNAPEPGAPCTGGLDAPGKDS
ncbi:DUF3105 domain-containing protein [uncultured Microbacterium sp.]|uniref:DUF3105 domain-containing protein n=1 Tax=uncultured Microbacterium sp. TaxID=191216 RepID=UPI0026228711|nr:DUF3105 domain-containing protein [uncultured Microbacterium sp.]